jgi:hypothetical protein
VPWSFKHLGKKVKTKTEKENWETQAKQCIPPSSTGVLVLSYSALIFSLLISLIVLFFCPVLSSLLKANGRRA